ncbi:MAG: DUF169 domain-containing protein [Deltaproteobacteria bacterium]|nr:DUF169 domain-containing protein [Deltaproteobacteria bacterium]
MNLYQSISQDLVNSLSLLYEPVGIALYRDTDALPADIPFTQKELKSYCQALVLAGEGEVLLLRKEQMGCKLGTSVLGFEKDKDMEAYLDDGVLEKYGVGLFGSEEASADTILNSMYLEKGKTQAAFIAPLSEFQQKPQVVIFTANSEQVMWLLYALNYEKGGKMNLPQSGGALGGCSDITALPLLKEAANITFLGLGCRMKSAVDPCHLMLGIPAGQLEKIHVHISDMSKPIAMLNKQSST